MNDCMNASVVEKKRKNTKSGIRKRGKEISLSIFYFFAARDGTQKLKIKFFPSFLSKLNN
jgi:hypothetical protein